MCPRELHQRDIKNKMSNIINQRFVEGVDENFQVAIKDKNWVFASTLIDDLKEFGFEKEAKILTQELEQAMEKEKLLQDDIKGDSI